MQTYNNKIYSIGLPDPTETIEFIVPLFWYGWQPVILFKRKTRVIINNLVIFGAIEFDGEYLYDRRTTVFNHVN